jgi:hypothetical protein
MSAPCADDEIAALGDLDLEGLRSAWRHRFGEPPPLRSVDLLALLLAWRIQACQQGGLEAGTRAVLKRSGPVKAEGLDIGVGAVLRREWKGRVVEVLVEADGFRWEGQSYSSLSAAATAIAGTRWNGPRFFGLRPPARVS